MARKKIQMQTEIENQVQEPEEIAAKELIRLLKIIVGKKQISLVEWKNKRRELDSLTNEEWLFYVDSQLIKAGYKTECVLNPKDPSQINRTFSDLLVSTHCPY